MQYFFLTFSIFIILLLTAVCFFRCAPRIDEGNSDIYGPDFVSIDDDREGKY